MQPLTDASLVHPALYPCVSVKGSWCSAEVQGYVCLSIGRVSVESLDVGSFFRHQEP